MRENFKGGKAVFTVAPFPIKCGGAPQKIAYLSDDTWRKNGVREKTEIRFMAATPVMFPPSPYYNTHLTETAKSKGFKISLKHQLVKVDKDNRKAYFRNLDDEAGDLVELDYDFLHICPNQKPHEFISESVFAAANGYFDVDMNLLYNKTYTNVFSLGDSANL